MRKYTTMETSIIVSGFGGQGALFAGQLLAYAAMDSGRNVTWIPSYGPEMRGGTAYCTVVISDRLIGSPIIRNPMHLVAMNRPSLEKFAPVVKPNGVILVNSSLISIGADRSDVDEMRVPVNEIAIRLGSVRSANIVALSAFVARSGVVPIETLRTCVADEFSKKKKLIPLNMAAVDEGRKAAAAA